MSQHSFVRSNGSQENNFFTLNAYLALFPTKTCLRMDLSSIFAVWLTNFIFFCFQAFYQEIKKMFCGTVLLFFLRGKTSLCSVSQQNVLFSWIFVDWLRNYWFHIDMSSQKNCHSNMKNGKPCSFQKKTAINRYFSQCLPFDLKHHLFVS